MVAHPIHCAAKGCKETVTVTTSKEAGPDKHGVTFDDPAGWTPTKDGWLCPAHKPKPNA